MKLRNDIHKRFILIVGAPMLACLLTQCATHEVEQELKQNVTRKGEVYARELAAQSPFEKMEISWNEASELMKERNLKYRQALKDEVEASQKRGLVNNLTHEVRKSLTTSVQNTLNPSEIAKAMKDPVQSIPRQLESITDLKNITHSLTQSEWERVSQGVEAEMIQRKEMVNLHALFCQSENLKRLKSDMALIAQSDKLEKGKEVDKELVKLEKLMKKERGTWLDKVRDFFNAEYHDVELNNYTRKLSFYRGVDDPGFNEWERWAVLEYSDTVANEMKVSHQDAKPVLPGIVLLKEKFGVNDLRSQLASNGMPDNDTVSEVRKMLKNWRQLKSVQQEISELEVKVSNVANEEAIKLADLKKVSKLYELKKQEVDYLKMLWLKDEQCWG